MVWEPMLAAVNEAIKAKERRSGSPGIAWAGPLALLAAWRLQRSFVSVQEIVTFGGTMIGNEAASKAFEQDFSGKIFRFVDLEDLVPHLPSVSLVANAYTHCLNEVGLAAARSPRGRVPIAPTNWPAPAPATGPSMTPWPNRSGRRSRAGSRRT